MIGPRVERGVAVVIGGESSARGGSCDWGERR